MRPQTDRSVHQMFLGCREGFVVSWAFQNYISDVERIIKQGQQILRALGKILLAFQVPYFLGYKTYFFSFQNNPKDLDPSYKTDLDL